MSALTSHGEAITELHKALDEIERLREALKDIQRASMAVRPPRHSWYYDRAEAALNQQLKQEE